MTTRQEDPFKFDPGDYPALLEFLPAYLHQDFGEEYGTPAKALEAFLADASADEIQNLREDWSRLRQATDDDPVGNLHQALGALGVAWRPESEAEIRAIDEILSRPEP